MGLIDLQRMLNGHGFPCGNPDGVLGPSTKAAVSRFQQAYCGPGGWLGVDGIPGPATEAAIVWMQGNNALVSHFTVDELKCKHCGLCYVKRELLAAMFKLREASGPIVVLDAYRCPEHNAAVGGASDSQHPKGTAFDPGTNLTIAQVRNAHAFTGIGSPNKLKATHLDVRPGNPNSPSIFFDASVG